MYLKKATPQEVSRPMFTFWSDIRAQSLFADNYCRDRENEEKHRETNGDVE
jgi:hypothetical protein